MRKLDSVWETGDWKEGKEQLCYGTTRYDTVSPLLLSSSPLPLIHCDSGKRDALVLII